MGHLKTLKNFFSQFVTKTALCYTNQLMPVKCLVLNCKSMITGAAQTSLTVFHLRQFCIPKPPTTLNTGSQYAYQKYKHLKFCAVY